jgi:hypothetical protein
MSIALTLTVLLLAAEPAAVAGAQEDKTRQEAVAILAPTQAKQLALAVGDDRPIAGELRTEPLLRWSNPTAGSVYGEVFLWTVNKRPAAIASIYRWYHPYKDSTVELVSVAERGMAATEGDVTHWKTKTPGLHFADLPKAPMPAQSARARLGQMRSLAREFSTELTDKRSGDVIVRKLRLLDQPVHRYESEGNNVLDGGLFAFVEGTDPEAWLLLEAVGSDAERRWQFALARMNIDELRIRRDGAIVKEWPGLRDAWSDRTTPYVMFNFDPDKLPVSKEPRQ